MYSCSSKSSGAKYVKDDNPHHLAPRYFPEYVEGASRLGYNPQNVMRPRLPPMKGKSPSMVSAGTALFYDEEEELYGENNRNQYTSRALYQTTID